VALVVQLRGSPDHPQPAAVAPDTLSPGVPAGDAASTAPPPASVEAEAVFSTRVVHRHRLGNCRGVLSVSRQGIEYAPEGNDPKDAFRFAYGQFVHGVDGDGLTIKTSDRTFRFEPLTINGVRDGKELAALGASLNARR
jgi:hypothetical protein